MQTDISTLKHLLNSEILLRLSKIIVNLPKLFNTSIRYHLEIFCLDLSMRVVLKSCWLFIFCRDQRSYQFIQDYFHLNYKEVSKIQNREQFYIFIMQSHDQGSEKNIKNNNLDLFLTWKKVNIIKRMNLSKIFNNILFLESLAKKNKENLKPKICRKIVDDKKLLFTVKHVETRYLFVAIS